MSKQPMFSENRLYLVQIPEKQLRATSFVGEHGEAEFYRLVAWCVGADFGKFDFDCRKILVSRELVQQWYDEIPPWESTERLAAALAIYGPKADEELPYNHVIIEPGGIKAARE